MTLAQNLHPIYPFPALITDCLMDLTTQDGSIDLLSENDLANRNRQLWLTFSSKEARQEQKLRELEQRATTLQLRAKKTDEGIRKGRSAQTDGGRGLLAQVVPSIVEILERDADKKARLGQVGFAMKEYNRIKSWVDPYTLAHIALTKCINLVGFGQRFSAKVSRVQKEIGAEIEDEAMLSSLYIADPRFYGNLQKYYLNRPERTYASKVGGVKHALNKSDLEIWQPMTEEEQVKLGAFMLRAICALVVDPETMQGLFDVVSPQWHEVSENQKKRAKQHSYSKYLVYTPAGLRLKEKLQQVFDDNYSKPEPMVCFPGEWTINDAGELTRGGHVIPLPGKNAHLLHNNNKAAQSKVTPLFLEGFNRAAKTICEIDAVVLDLELTLSQTTTAIGSFNSVERDSFFDLHMPVRDPALDEPDPDAELLQQYKRQKAKAHSEFRLAEQQAESPRRVLKKAEEYRDRQFCFSLFADYRGRIYPLGDLHQQTADWCRALIKSAMKFPVTPQTEIDLLIHIANTGAFDGIDKQSYADRINWARDYVHSEKVRAFVEQPLTWTSWHDADSPFCHFQACYHYYELFIFKTKRYADVFCYSDSTCSGLQLISGVQRFTDGCLSTNVIHTSKPGDAYQVVADAAIELLSNPEYMRLAFAQRHEETLARNKKRPDDQQIALRGNTFEFDISKLDRSSCKLALMTYLYSATFQTIHNSIFDKLKSKQDIDVHPGDKTIISRAVLQSIQTKFKAAEDVNTFIQDVVKLTLASGKDHVSWISPAGLECVSIAQIPLFKEVRCHAAGGGHYSKVERDEWGSSYLHSGWGDVLPRKILSATPACVVHSWDSSTLLGGYMALEPHEPCLSVHDSVGYVAGRSTHVLPHFRRSFYNVITSNLLEGLVEENNLDGKIAPPAKGNAPVEESLTSEYLFC